MVVIIIIEIIKYIIRLGGDVATSISLEKKINNKSNKFFKKIYYFL